MARISTAELRRYILGGQISRQGCLRNNAPRAIPFRPSRKYATVSSSSSPSQSPPIIPLRKQLKDAAKAAKPTKKKPSSADNQQIPGWDLTVGIEIHAQLNTPRKLFSSSLASSSDSSFPPNTLISPFDLAIPGSQPIFQPETLIPAIRAALALNCSIEQVSRFDRKHYFHWDQPAGYQITQYYSPFARSGYIELFPRDGIAKQDGDVFRVGIKQVQMEQDTGKTMVMSTQEGDDGQAETHHVDFNRVGVPLIEIITEPTMHSPATAAAFVRKVQMLLYAVNACVSGMESGGLRADVNVSVRRAGETGLGTRTEIKNLNSFKAVEDAIIAERDRQIRVLEEGGTILGETRGWSLGSGETRRLRGKEGEVDYRYMPDPDLGPVVVDSGLVRYLGDSMGVLPDQEIDQLVGRYGLSTKDAMALMGLDNGARVQYFYRVLDQLEEKLGLGVVREEEDDVVALAGTAAVDDAESGEMRRREQKHALLAANWCLHELGKLTEVASDLGMTADGECAIPSGDLATLLAHLYKKEITASVAKELLWSIFRGEIVTGGVTDVIEEQSLWFDELSYEEYADLADEVVDGQEKVLGEFVRFQQGLAGKKGYPQGKLMFLVGQMMRSGPEHRMDPASAERIMKQRLEEVYVPRVMSKEAN
ncbi:Glutamyl-tRNA amidotransferase subunit B, mitochondrial [Rhypophila decipiens]|uniref:Glutamyl-tRNA(Gln) amidotransferase subunit B, mitochondrial n=1 Tax=Rhypophila decipiens TaxID=261697 RepID=A0AAN6Y4H2_9PEZI|nr:Glutamyl-tRNA amidotransferase subunit B, mitochondrial [Rhypophila decipiens]